MPSLHAQSSRTPTQCCCSGAGAAAGLCSDFWKQLAKIGNTIVSQLVSLVIIVGTIIAILAYLKGIKP